MNSTATPPQTRVWDLGVRLFHWGLVATFIVAYLSGEQHELHTWAGYTLIALLAFRLVWGFAGSRHARFGDFLRPPGEVWRYLAGLVRGRPPHYRGHNPAGGWMIALMLTTLTLIAYSGLQALALEGEGPFAHLELRLVSTAHAHGGERHGSKEATMSPAPQGTPPAPAGSGATSPPLPATATQPIGADGRGLASLADRAPHPTDAEMAEENFWSWLHHNLVNLMLLLIALHLLGVIVSSLLHRENLVRAMVTGHKPLPVNRPDKA